MYTLGIDIGSTTSKCVILEDGDRLVSKSLEVGGMGTTGPDDAVRGVMQASGLTSQDIDRTIVTGYGRMRFQGADGEVSELTCHALGASHIFDGLRTVIDIGGQDAKIIALSPSGRMTNFVMNDKCAAGTGRFLDVMANILRIDVNDMGEIAAKAEGSAQISSTCTVFAESEVISQMANGVRLPELVSGICDSVASRVSALARRVGVKEKVCMSGGVARNGAVKKALERNLEVEILTSPLSQYFGAIGAALYAYRQASRSEE